MMNDTEIWLERLNSLYKSQMRQAASKQALQLVHVEILQYLSICNHYSNTAQALSEYLGQTKGSISQSLKVLENLGYIKREPSLKDKRVAKLYLTEQGTKGLKKVSSSSELTHKDDEKTIALIKPLLMHLQNTNNVTGFGQCKSCVYNQKLGTDDYKCGLTNEALSKTDVRKICREHEFHQ